MQAAFPVVVCSLQSASSMWCLLLVPPSSCLGVCNRMGKKAYQRRSAESRVQARPGAEKCRQGGKSKGLGAHVHEGVSRGKRRNEGRLDKKGGNKCKARSVERGTRSRRGSILGMNWCKLGAVKEVKGEERKGKGRMETLKNHF